MRFHLYIFFTVFCVHSIFLFFSLRLFEAQLLFLNIYQKMINGVGWLDDRHGLSPILYDTAPLCLHWSTIVPLCFHLL